jgi:hypothetical protein
VSFWISPRVSASFFCAIARRSVVSFWIRLRVSASFFCVIDRRSLSVFLNQPALFVFVLLFELACLQLTLGSLDVTLVPELLDAFAFGLCRLVLGHLGVVLLFKDLFLEP